MNIDFWIFFQKKKKFHLQLRAVDYVEKLKLGGHACLLSCAQFFVLILSFGVQKNLCVDVTLNYCFYLLA